VIQKIKRILRYKDTKSLFENFVSLSIIKFVDLIIPILIVPLLLSRVGITNYGKYAFSYSIIFYFLNVTQYGFSLSAVREIATNIDSKERVNNIFNKVMTTKIVLTILVYIALICLVFAVPKLTLERKLYFFTSLIILGDLFDPTWFYQGIEKMKFITFVSVFSKSLYIGLVYVFVDNVNDYPLIGLFQSIGYMVLGLLAILYTTRKYGIKFKLTSLAEVKSQLRDGTASFFTLTTPLLYANSSIFLTGLFGLPVHVSYIEIATKVSGAFGALNGIMTQIFYPFVNRQKSKIEMVRKILLYLGLFTSICMFAFAPLLMKLWLKDDLTREIIILVQILSLSPFLLSVKSAFGVNGLLILNKDRLYLRIILICSVLGLIIGVSLIPVFLYNGAVIAIISTRIFLAILLYFNYEKVKYI
jgi:PST family polysaccharide transporter